MDSFGVHVSGDGRNAGTNTTKTARRLTWNRLVEFFLSIARGISLSSTEKSSLEDIVRTLRDVAVLINDYYSYDKEAALHRMRKNPGRAFNGVAVSMVQHSITKEEALAMLKGMILEAEQQHVTAFEEAQRENRLTEKLFRYVEGWRHFTSGNSLWHAASPRYASALLSTADGTVPVFGEYPFKVRLEKKDELSNITVERTTGNEHAENDGLITHDQNGLLGYSDSLADFQSLNQRLRDPRRLRPGDKVLIVILALKVEVVSHYWSRLSPRPFDYLASLSSKKTWEIFIHSLCAWLDVPIPDVEKITLAVSATHNVTLM